MGRGKLPRRLCEECGRVIESKRPGVNLCKICQRGLDEELEARERRRRKERGRVRSLEDRLYSQW